MTEVVVHLHQIAYSPQTLAAIEPGYAVLDNLANLRPDWYEYWPIRQYLLTQALDEAAFYGFFSPKFGVKTALRHADVVRVVQGHAPMADVVLFSPQPDMGAFFLNVFEQGEFFDSGLIDAFEAFLQHIGRPVALRSLVMDSRQVVFSNYFVARPAFWRAWLVLCEQFFAVCEGPAGHLRDALIQPTSYSGAVQRKVFLLERIASLMLALEPAWRVRAADPFPFAWSMSRFREHPAEAVISDALKVAYREQPFPEYLAAFSRIRQIFNAPRPAG
jgi:hypothetical protein